MPSVGTESPPTPPTPGRTDPAGWPRQSGLSPLSSPMSVEAANLACYGDNPLVTQGRFHRWLGASRDLGHGGQPTRRGVWDRPQWSPRPACVLWADGLQPVSRRPHRQRRTQPRRRQTETTWGPPGQVAWGAWPGGSRIALSSSVQALPRDPDVTDDGLAIVPAPSSRIRSTAVWRSVTSPCHIANRLRHHLDPLSARMPPWTRQTTGDGTARGRRVRRSVRQ